MTTALRATRSADAGDLQVIKSAVTRNSATYENFRRAYDAEPERKWQVEVVNALCAFAENHEGWDGYGGQPLKPDAGIFALSVLNDVMSNRTPIPQVIPLSGGGIQIEWHERDVDLELAVYAPYQAELWFDDLRSDQPPISIEMTVDFAQFRKAIKILTNR